MVTYTYELWLALQQNRRLDGKEYRQAIHRWSYNRLIDSIRGKAQQLGIRVESGFQPLQGTHQEQAKDMAIAAYHARTIATK